LNGNFRIGHLSPIFLIAFKSLDMDQLQKEGVANSLYAQPIPRAAELTLPDLAMEPTIDRHFGQFSNPTPLLDRLVATRQVTDFGQTQIVEETTIWDEPSAENITALSHST
jgi:hypothetical protein